MRTCTNPDTVSYGMETYKLFSFGGVHVACYFDHVLSNEAANITGEGSLVLRFTIPRDH